MTCNPNQAALDMLLYGGHFCDFTRGVCVEHPYASRLTPCRRCSVPKRLDTECASNAACRILNLIHHERDARWWRHGED